MSGASFAENLLQLCRQVRYGQQPAVRLQHTVRGRHSAVVCWVSWCPKWQIPRQCWQPVGCRLCRCRLLRCPWYVRTYRSMLLSRVLCPLNHQCRRVFSVHMLKSTAHCLSIQPRLSACCNHDCMHASCMHPVFKCDDSTKNGDEVGIDCGGSCPACPTGCFDTGDGRACQSHIPFGPNDAYHLNCAVTIGSSGEAVAGGCDIVMSPAPAPPQYNAADAYNTSAAGSR